MPSWGRWSRRCRPGGRSVRRTCRPICRCVARTAVERQRPRRLLAPHRAYGSRSEPSESTRCRCCARWLRTSVHDGLGSLPDRGLAPSSTTMVRGPRQGRRWYAPRACARLTGVVGWVPRTCRGGRRRERMILNPFQHDHARLVCLGEARNHRPPGRLPLPRAFLTPHRHASPAVSLGWLTHPDCGGAV